MKPDQARAVVYELVLRAGQPLGRSELVRWCPHKPHPKQRAFLELDCDEALYGGAAGGGKSDALLMGALQYVDVPGYAALLLRKSYTDLSLPGAIMDRAAGWLTPTAARWNGDTKTWHFPSGATITFGYLENDADRFRYASAEFQLIAFDELTQHSEIRYTFMHSRIRRPDGASDALGRVPLRMRAASNPGGVGHAWVKRRWGIRTDGTQEAAPGERPLAFVRALLEDNPSLDREAYEKSLAKLDPVTQDQLRRGLWVSATGRVFYYDPARNDVVELPAITGWRFILSVDLGASETTPTTSFSVIAWHPEVTKSYVVLSFKESSHIPSTIADKTHELEQTFGIFQRYVLDEGALGKGYGGELRLRHQIPFVAAQKANKDAYRKLLNGALHNGEVVVVREQCLPLIREFEGLTWNEDGTKVVEGEVGDHCSDGVLYGWRESRAFLSEAPDQRPAYGTTEWFEAEAVRIRKAEIERAKQRASKPAYERW